MSEKDHNEEKNAETGVKPELLSPEELERMKEAKDERKKLIQSLRGETLANEKEARKHRNIVIFI